MPRFFANDSGTVREASRIFVNDNGTIREATMIWQLMGSTSRLVYTSGVPTFIASDTLTSGTSASWSPRTGITYSRVHVWVIGAGGSGGASSTDSGREKNSNGGGAGGTAYRVFNRADITSGGTFTIGTGGTSVSVSGGGSNSSGRSGGATTFIAGGITMRGNGGGSGSGGRNTVGEGSTTNTSGAWGAVSAVSGGTASGGTANYTGGGQVANSIGGNGSRAVSGASTNLTGQTTSTLNGVVISGGGFQQGQPGPRPTRPSFPDIQSFRTYFPTDSFQGGAAQQHSSGGPVTGAVGSPYGAGGGSASSEGPLATSGAGGNGVVIILYEGRAAEIPVFTANVVENAPTYEAISSVRWTRQASTGSTMVSSPQSGFIVTYAQLLETMNQEAVGPTLGDGTWRIRCNLAYDITTNNYDNLQILFINVADVGTPADPGGWESVRIIVTGVTSGNVSEYTTFRVGSEYSTFVLITSTVSYNDLGTGTFSGTLPNVGEQTTMTIEFTSE